MVAKLINDKLMALAIAALFAATAPIALNSNSATNVEPTTTSLWPTKYEGKTLTELPLTAKEQLFIVGFPGQIKRFSDGKRELIIRKVSQPTRMLHPAIDCFKGIGYQIEPLPIQTNKQGIKMGCFNAHNNTHSLKVCEYIKGSNGQSWSDVSSWYWDTFWSENSDASSEQGWLSVVIAQSN